MFLPHQKMIRMKFVEQWITNIRLVKMIKIKKLEEEKKMNGD